MNILIFKTAGNLQFENLLKKIDSATNRIIVLLPNTHSNKLIKRKPEVEYIELQNDHIDYTEIANRGIIPNVVYDVVYIISSKVNDMSNFSECYCVIEDIKWRKWVYIDVNKNEHIIVNTLFRRFYSMVEKYIMGFTYKIIENCTLLQNIVLGYRW